MLSRLSGLANNVLHELSGDYTDWNMMASSEAELPQESAMESNNSTQEDVLDRLADAEKLVVELKDLISQKDAQLQQKDEALQEEKKAAENKINKKNNTRGIGDQIKLEAGPGGELSLDPEKVEPLSSNPEARERLPSVD